ncbi:CGNR zinc finger domain-containing protein [Dactylosporangium salmoneum]|uniref:Zinc finger CGNR domain-containing protein n=1 Tax=Dactylosporangium salmoneum TaxID=53361 RepID=A0ABP5V4M8_9ACTN
MPTARRPAHAPDDLDVLRDFANATDLPAEDAERVAAFRHAVRGLLAANAELADPGPALREFNALLDWLGAAARLLSLRRTGITTAGGGARPALARLAGIVLDAVHAGTFARLKLCANPSCGRAFYDHGRNAAGRWCDMATCGNRAKVAGYRSRLRTPADQPHSIDEALTDLATRPPR